MDASLRNNIMKSILVKEQKQEETPTLKTSSAPVPENKLWEFRKKLKYVHAYENIIKEDSENFSEDQWLSFEKWYLNNKPKPKIMDSVSAAFEAKRLREQQELAKRSEIRKNILREIKLKL